MGRNQSLRFNSRLTLDAETSKTRSSRRCAELSRARICECNHFSYCFWWIRCGKKAQYTIAMTRRHRMYVALACAAFGWVLAFGQAKDPFVGTWLLDRGKSDFMPYFPLQRRTMIMAAVDNGVNCVIRTVSDRQETTEVTYSAHYDGKDVPIESSALDTVSLRRIDANTVERKGKIRGNVVESALMKISADGKVLTIMTEGSIPNGEPYKSLQVFNRQ